MLKFIFVIILLTIISSFAIIYYIAGGALMEAFFKFDSWYLFFILIGLIIFISGLKVVIKDNKIKRYGIQCYGIIRLL